jgi:Fe-S cluster assembly protein SufD
VSPFEESAAATLSRLPAGGPAWLAELRAAGAAAFRAAGLPTARHEDWRFTSLASLAATAVGPAAPGPAPEALLAALPPALGPRLVFANGRFRPDLSTAAGLPAGAVVASLGEALRQSPELVRPYLGRLARPDGIAFTGLNAALFDDGAFVHLPAGAIVEAPIVLVFACGGAEAPPSGTGAEAPPPSAGADAPVAAHHPRVLVVAGEGAKATIEEVYVGAGAYLTAAVTELHVAPGAQLEHLKLQDEDDRAFHVSAVFAEQGAGSRLSSHALSLGARLSRAELRSRHAGEEASLSASGLYMADASRVTDAFTWVEHAVPRCSTSEAYKGILDGHARGVFAGRIVVQRDAQKSDARQMNSNLLLSEDAVVDTKPQLEIFADDVKCGHGGTVGQLDEDALFYLRSRGVGEVEARSLLIWAFAAEMVDRFGPEVLRARARQRVAARLPAGQKLLEAA